VSDLRKLNKAVQTAGFPSHDFAQAVREWIAAATERMEPEKVCGVKHAHRLSSAFGTGMDCGEGAPKGGWPYFNEPAPPSEMPLDRARQIAAQCWCDPETEMIEMDGRLAGAFAKRLVEAWRTQPAQPAPSLRMTPELERVLDYIDRNYEIDGEIQELAAAVRQQVSQPVKLEKVREAMADARSLCVYLNDNPPYGTDPRRVLLKLNTALAELIAAEGKVTG